MSSSSGPATGFCKCICCDATKKHGLTWKVPIDNLIAHIASIFHAEGSSDLSQDWPFLDELISSHYFNNEDLTIFKSIQLAESSQKLTMYEDLITNVKGQISNLASIDVPTSTSFKTLLQAHLDAIEISLTAFNTPLQEKKDRQAYLSQCNDMDVDSSHWINKLKGRTGDVSTSLQPYLDSENGTLFVRICKPAKSSPTSSIPSTAASESSPSNTTWNTPAESITSDVGTNNDNTTPAPRQTRASSKKPSMEETPPTICQLSLHR